MPKTKIFEGKTTNDAIEKGLKELHTTKENVEIKVIEEEKRSFFSILEPRKVKVEITLKEEKDNTKQIKRGEIEEISKDEIEQLKSIVEKFVEDFIKTLPSNEIQYKVKYEDNYIMVEMDGKDINYLIGYRGEVLNSIQTIISSIISSNTKNHVRAILDIGNYKEKRKKTLENLAERTANNVIRKGKQITLEPMKPYERKIIHSKLQENEKVKTYSVGQEPYRKIVIAPK